MSIITRAQAVAPGNLLGLWPLNETVGAGSALDHSGNGYDGTPTDVTFAAYTGPDGDNAASFNGSSSFIELFGSGVENVIDVDAGTMMVWIKVSAAGIWTDGNFHRAFQVSTGSAANMISIEKHSTNNSLRTYYDGSSTVDFVDYDPSSSTDWICVVCTWDTVADEFIMYIDGTQTGSTQTGLGNWVGAITDVNIGSRWDATHNWSGGIADAAVWDVVLTPTLIDYIVNGTDSDPDLVTRRVYFDWDKDGSFTDMSDYVVSVSGTIGRTDWQSRIADVGIVIIELKNDTRYFSPENSASPYYGQMVPNIPVRVEVSDISGTYRLLTVWTSDWEPRPGQYEALRCTVTCIDRIGQLQDADLALPIQVGQTTGAIIRRITSTAYESGQATATAYMREVADTHTLTVDETTYTFKDTITATANDVALGTQDYFFNELSGGGGITDAAVNAAAAINRDNRADTDYSDATERQKNVTALGYMGIGWDESNYDSDLDLQRTGTAYEALACSFSWAFNGAFSEPVFLPFRRVYLYLKKVGSPTGTLTLRHEIPTGAGGSPSGTLYNASGTITMSEADLTTSFAWYAFDWPAEYEMENYSIAGVTYLHWLVLSTDRATSGTDYVVWGRDSASSARFSDDTKTGGAWSGRTGSVAPLIYIPGILDLTASIHGAWGNSLALAQTGNQIVVSGATFSGGVDGPVGNIDADVGINTLDYAGDTWAEGETTALTAVTDITDSEFGLFWANKSGDLVFRDQQFEFEQTNAAAEMTCSDGHTGQLGRLSKDDVINRVTISYQPRAVLAATVIAKANKPYFITANTQRPAARWNAYEGKSSSGIETPGQRLITLAYNEDSSGEQVGALSLTQPLEPGTDFEIWGTKDKTGPEATSFGLVNFALALTGSGVQVQITNTAARWGWVHELQVRGVGLYKQAITQMIREDATSRTAYGLRAFEFTLPFPSANIDAFAEVLAWYFINRFKDPRYIVTSVSVRGERTINGTSVFSLDIGDVIDLSETQTAVANFKLMIMGIDFLLPENDVHEITYYVTRLNSNNYWELGIAGFSELGETTYLAL